MSTHSFWSKAFALELLPLSVGVPAVIFVVSVKPHDVSSNLSAWLEWVGVPDIPKWVAAPDFDWKFGIVAIAGLLTYTFVVWGVPRLPKGRRMYPLVMMCAGAFLLVGGLVWDWRSAPGNGTIGGPKFPWKHTLEDLFKADFSDVMNYQTNFSIKNVAHILELQVDVNFRMFYDFRSNIYFVSIFIPNLKDARAIDDIQNIIQYIAGIVKTKCDEMKNNIVVMTGMPGSPMSDSRNMTFSGRVFIYTENALSVIQIGEITKFYQEKGMFIQIRGNDYWWLNKDR